MSSPYLTPGHPFTRADGEPFTPAEHEAALRLAVMQTVAAMCREQIETSGTFDLDKLPPFSEIRARIIQRAFPDRAPTDDEVAL